MTTVTTEKKVDTTAEEHPVAPFLRMDRIRLVRIEGRGAVVTAIEDSIPIGIGPCGGAGVSR